MSALQVVKPGFLSTLQDLGRPHLAHLGISASGAADALALRLGNLVLGNAADAPAIEMTLVGATFTATGDTIAVLTGADCGAVLAAPGSGIPVPPWQPTRIPNGGTLALGPCRNGARSYLCVRGGFDVPPVLGSASTHLVTGLGGLGRPLQEGDTLAIKPVDVGSHRVQLDAAWLATLYAPGPFRITPAPQADWFDADAHTRIGTETYEVREQSNRMGIRLRGAALARRRPGELLTEGVALGAIQVPENGQPIILFVEHQTTGGYPKIANICSADMHRVGQLRPRDHVRFAWVSFDAARRLVLKHEDTLARVRMGDPP